MGIKLIFRLNRIIIVSLFYFASLVIGPVFGHSRPTLGWGLVLVTLLLWIFNQSLFRLIKQQPAVTDKPNRLVLLWSITLCGICALAGLLTGLWGIMALTLPASSIFFANHVTSPLQRLAVWGLLIGALLLTCWTAQNAVAIGQWYTHRLLMLLPLLVFFGAMVQQFSLSLLQHQHHIDHLQAMATTDVLTGLLNRRQFNQRLTTEIARAKRHATPLSLALFDIDNFKHINDFYGHPTGDRILQELGYLLRNNIREHDLAARYGGEEFALILPETPLNKAEDLLERLRLLIARHVFCLPEHPITLTISIGVATLSDTKHDPNLLYQFVETVDNALYEAKRQGKNRVVTASSPISINAVNKSMLPEPIPM
jgi:diguanylate cyclase (GGDEF)-like protein